MTVDLSLALADFDDTAPHVVTRRPAPCPKLGQCTSLHTGTPDGAKCFTWLHTEIVGTSTNPNLPVAWQAWGYEDSTRSNGGGPYIVLCTASCVGFEYFEC